MLACVRWTLTHSSGWAAVLVGLALAPLAGAELEAMNASRVAETVADDEAEPEPETEPDGDGDTGALLGLLAGFVPDDAGADAGAVGEPEPDELEEGDGDGDGEPDGFGVPDGDGEPDGVGVGVDVAAAGRAWHLVSVFGAALVEVLRLAEASSAFIVPAYAAVGQPASTPRVRDPPATRLSTVARTCARRMKTALSPIIEVTGCSLWGL
jgi:hypothetical protein